MPYSAYLQDKINDHIFKGDITGTAFTQPRALYLGLHNADPGPTNSPSTEISSDYEKQRAYFSLSSAGFITNSTEMTFLELPSTTITHVSIWDENDNYLVYDEVEEIDIDTDDDFVIQVGALKINAKSQT